MTLDPTTLDRRRIPARPDLAAAHLKGKLEAERYAEATPLAVSSMGSRTPLPRCSLESSQPSSYSLRPSPRRRSSALSQQA